MAVPIKCKVYHYFTEFYRFFQNNIDFSVSYLSYRREIPNNRVKSHLRTQKRAGGAKEDIFIVFISRVVLYESRILINSFLLTMTMDLFS